MTTTREAKAQEATEAATRLREVMPVGTTVYTILRHRSGDTRAISTIVVRVDESGKGADVFDWSFLVARALGRKIDERHDGIRTHGGGMDMGYGLVHDLARTLYPDGWFCTGDRSCPSNDHVNDRSGANYTPGRHHPSGGYALHHRWL